MRPDELRLLTEARWTRWQRAIAAREPVALGALQRLRAELESGIISKHHDWETIEVDDKRGWTYERTAGYDRKRYGTAVAELTPREVEVLQAAADVGSNQRVADRLGISIDTVKSHWRKIMLKLDARTRTHAVAIAIRAGTIR